MSSSNGSGGEAIVPLAPDLWFGRLRTLAKRLKDDEAGLEEALRHAYHLTQMAPGPFNEIVECKTAEEVFEGYLEAGAFDDAARALTSSAYFEFTIEVSDDHYLILVRSPIFDITTSMAGHQEGIALFRGWIEALLAIESAAREAGFSPTRQAPRRRRSGPRRQSMQH